MAHALLPLARTANPPEQIPVHIHASFLSATALCLALAAARQVLKTAHLTRSLKQQPCPLLLREVLWWLRSVVPTSRLSPHKYGLWAYNRAPPYLTRLGKADKVFRAELPQDLRG